MRFGTSHGWRRLAGPWIGAMLAVLPLNASAQLGDKADRPEETQRLLVPRELIPPALPLAPSEALRSFRIAPGFHLELVASEPLIEDPIAMQFGADGAGQSLLLDGMLAGAGRRSGRPIRIAAAP